DGDALRPNLTSQGLRYLEALGEEPEELFFHLMGALHSPAYASGNLSALRQDWPRIPLPASRDDLLASAALGRQIAALLNTESPVPGVSSGDIRPDLRPLGVIACADGGELNLTDDLEVTAGWGHAGKGGVTMPGAGNARLREYGMGERVEGLGERTYDIYLNDRAYWRNVPERVWNYTIGGYQVVKKWLSYRESKLLGRPLKPEEARYVTEMVRRIAAIILLEPELDANYERVKANTYPWPGK
ncbi:MAG: type ISP restriction/modification enzyme, partial [Armatimonadia bacterium]